MSTKTKGRRPSGEGSIYRAADGRWRAVVDLGWADGRRQRKYVSGATQAETLAKLRAVQRDADIGVRTDARLSVAEFLDRWVAVNLPGNVTPGTLDNYSVMVRVHLNPALGRRRLAQLSVADVDSLWAAKRADGLAPNTIRIMRAVLRRALVQAEREGLISRNVAALSQPPRIGQPEGRALSVDQARTLLDHAAGHRLEAAFLLSLSYGLRRGELLGLAWADLDSSAATLAVRQALHKVNSSAAGTSSRRLELAELKTPRSRRTLYLTPNIVAALQEHRRRQDAERGAAGELWGDSGLIFTSTIGTPLDPDNFAKSFVALCESAGLGHWHPHEARHSAASVMLAQGVRLEVVSEVLGHSSITITKDVYGHLTEGAKRGAAEVMAAALGH